MNAPDPNCPRCHGTGRYVLFQLPEPCECMERALEVSPLLATANHKGTVTISPAGASWMMIWDHRVSTGLVPAGPPLFRLL